MPHMLFELNVFLQARHALDVPFMARVIAEILDEHIVIASARLYCKQKSEIKVLL